MTACRTARTAWSPAQPGCLSLLTWRSFHCGTGDVQFQPSSLLFMPPPTVSLSAAYQISRAGGHGPVTLSHAPCFWYNEKVPMPRMPSAKAALPCVMTVTQSCLSCSCTRLKQTSGAAQCDLHTDPAHSTSGPARLDYATFRMTQRMAKSDQQGCIMRHLHSPSAMHYWTRLAAFCDIHRLHSMVPACCRISPPASLAG